MSCRTGYTNSNGYQTSGFLKREMAIRLGIPSGWTEIFAVTLNQLEAIRQRQSKSANHSVGTSSAFFNGFVQPVRRISALIVGANTNTAKRFIGHHLLIEKNSKMSETQHNQSFRGKQTSKNLLYSKHNQKPLFIGE